jgi:predicted DNA-binding protein
MPDRIARPFPVTIEVEFLDRLSEPVRDGRAKSVSAIIRTALEEYDFSNVVVVHSSQLQISVRLPTEIRKNLKKVSRAKHTSVGQLVRAAVEAYLPKLEAAALKEKKKIEKAKKTAPKRKKKSAPKRK